MPSLDPYFANLLVVGWTLTDAHRKRLAPYFSSINHVPDGVPSDAHLAQADVIYGLPRGKYLTSLAQVPKLKLIQLGSAGSDFIVSSPMWKEEGGDKIGLTSASGTHVGPIGQYFIVTTLALFHRLQHQILISQNEKRWGSDEEICPGNWIFIEELRGKTVGVLGYGHIGREGARLASAFGARILAANSSGKKQPLGAGYNIPGTGDVEGDLPEAWFSTASLPSLTAFLSECDVVLLSLPSTPKTRHILNAHTLSYMKPSAVVVNVGRGDAIDTDALVEALDTGKLAGAALDVTSPEPLPDGHTLFGRKNVIITPHLSGRSIKYPDVALDVLVTNLERLREGKELVNVVDPLRGY